MTRSGGRLGILAGIPALLFLVALGVLSPWASSAETAARVSPRSTSPTTPTRAASPAASPAATPSASPTAALATAPASSVAPAPAGDVRPLIFWHSFRGQEETALQTVVSAWNLEHETTPIVLVARDGSVFTDDVEAEIAAGRGPDIFVWAHDKIGAWVEKGLLLPLDRHVDSSLRDVYMPNCLDAMFYQKKLYGLPLSFETLILYYNKTLVPQPPTTTDELIRIGKTLSDPRADRWGLVYERGNFYHHAMWFHGFGARVFDGDGDLDVMTLASIRSLEFARDLASVQRIIPDTVDWQRQMTLFNSGRAGMLISGPWAFGSIDRDTIDLGLAVLPYITPARSPAAPFLGVKGFYVSARTRRPAEAAAALAYLSSAYAGYVMNVLGGYMPANQLAYEYSMVAADPVTAKFKEQVLTSVPMPSDPRMGHVWKVMMMDNEAKKPGCLDRVFDRVPPMEAARAAYSDYHRLLRGQGR